MTDLLRRLFRRPEPEPPVDLDAVCADHDVIEAVLDDRIDDALAIAQQHTFVAMLVALRDSGRPA